MAACRSTLFAVYDVIIAGAGPVGLFLACELRLAKSSVLVLEQLEDPHSPLKRVPFGMRGLWGPSVEAFYRRGLLEQMAAQPRADGGGPGQPRPGSTAAGAERRGPAGHFAGIQFDYANIDPSRWTYRLPGPADTQLGAEMEHIERVLAAHALSAGVEIRRGQGVVGFVQSDDEVIVQAGEERIRARWLVGCDGGRSTVRKQGGFEFVGTDPEFTGYSVQVEIADPEKLPLDRHYTATGMYTQWQPGAIAIADFDGGVFHRTQPITREHVQTVLRHVSGTDVTPQGVDRRYTTERHPIGARILDWTRAQVAVMKPNRQSRALQAIVRDLIDTRDGATYFAERVWGVSLRYDLGDDHPLVGRSCPDFELEDGTRVGTRLRDGTGLLLDFDRHASLQALGVRWGDRARYVASDAKDRLGLSAVLVRPDGFVAWASSATPEPEAVTRAAARWFAG